MNGYNFIYSKFVLSLEINVTKYKENIFTSKFVSLFLTSCLYKVIKQHYVEGDILGWHLITMLKYAPLPYKSDHGCYGPLIGVCLAVTLIWWNYWIGHVLHAENILPEHSALSTSSDYSSFVLPILNQVAVF